MWTEEQETMIKANAGVMIMMYNATNEERYLDRSVENINKLTDQEQNLRSEFIRPLGVILKTA